MSKNEKFYRTLAIIAVVAIVAIAVVIVGPKLLEGGAKVSEATKEATDDTKQIVEDAAGAAEDVATEVKKAVSPKSWSAVSDGPEGVIEMFKSDPLYNGSDVNLVPENDPRRVEYAKSRGGQWVEIDSGTNPIVLEYEGYYFYFNDVEDDLGLAPGKYRQVGYSGEIGTSLAKGMPNRVVMISRTEAAVANNEPPPLSYIRDIMGGEIP